MKPFIYKIIVRDRGNKDKVRTFHTESHDHRFPCDAALSRAEKEDRFKNPYIDLLSVLGVKDF